MSNCRVVDLLPAYINGTLDEAEERAVQSHLNTCIACEMELETWKTVGEASALATENVADPSAAVLHRALSEIDLMEEEVPHAGFPQMVSRLSLAGQLLRGQFPLVRREIWIASPLTMAVGCLVALMTLTPNGAGLTLAIFAPIVAALGVAFIYGPENDPSLEVALSTPTSPRLVLLARLTLVYGYDLALSFAATGVLAIAKSGTSLWPLISLWIGPMLFLSALALVLSLLLGAATAVLVATGLWASRLVALSDATSAPTSRTTDLIEVFWLSNTVLLALAAVMLVAAFLYTQRTERLT